jgi:chromosome segregation ATPase
VTALAWRDDSKILASASEDGNIRWWDNDGKQAKSWSAHSGGVLSLAFAHDGKMVSCGRDNQVITWTTEGNKSKSFQFDGELPLRTVFSHDSERVIATDFAGRVAVWTAKDAKRVGELESNPLPLTERLARAEKRLTDLQAQAKQPNSELKNAEDALAKAKADLDAANKVAETAKTEQKASEDLVVKLKEEAAKAPPQEGLLTQVFPPPEHEKKLADARAARAKAREATTNALAAIETKKKDLEASETKLAQGKEKDPTKLIPAAKDEVAKWKAALAQTDLFRARQSLSTLKRELEAYNAFIAEKKTALEKAPDAEKSKVESELKTAEAAAKKIASDLSAQEAKVKKLAENFQQLKPTQLSSR